MSFGADPPDSGMGMNRITLRHFFSIQFIIPSGSNIRPQSSQIIKTGPRTTAFAVWATDRFEGPRKDHSLPLVAEGAFPPDFSVRPGGDIPRGEGAVLFVIPLFREFRKVCGKNMALILTIVQQDDHLPLRLE